MAEIAQIKLQIEILKEDIIDYIDENHDCDPSDSSQYINRLEELRTDYRSKVLELRQLDEENTSFDDILTKIKGCIKEKKDETVKFKLHNERKKIEAQIQHEKVAEFQLSEVKRCIEELEELFKKHV